MYHNRENIFREELAIGKSWTKNAKLLQSCGPMTWIDPFSMLYLQAYRKTHDKKIEVKHIFPETSKNEKKSFFLTWTCKVAASLSCELQFGAAASLQQKWPNSGSWCDRVSVIEN